MLTSYKLKNNKNVFIYCRCCIEETFLVKILYSFLYRHHAQALMQPVAGLVSKITFFFYTERLLQTPMTDFTHLSCHYSSSQRGRGGTLPAGRLGQAVPQGPGLMMTSAALPRWSWCLTLPRSSACWLQGRDEESKGRKEKIHEFGKSHTRLKKYFYR